MRLFVCYVWVVVAVVLMSSRVIASEYPVPSANQALFGEVRHVLIKAPTDSSTTMAQKFNIGFNAISEANPDLNLSYTFREGTLLTIPTAYLLPDAARTGIVINLPEMRLYYYPKRGGVVQTYPIGIGKIGKTIPIAKTSIVRKAENPTWYPTESIRAFNKEQGIDLPKVMPAGPDNPLGKFAIYTGLTTYLIHSTIFPESIGKRASFGCIRMFVNDIESIFPEVEKNIPVVIVNVPKKLAWHDQTLYLEAHRPLEEHHGDPTSSLPGVVHRIVEMTKDQPVLVDWQLVAHLTKANDGIPREIGVRLS